MSIFRDWSQLPGELIDLISTKIIFADDYVIFRAVCSSWRSSSSATPRHLPLQFPWLLLPNPDPKSSARSFLSIIDEHIFSLDFHEAQEQRCCGSCHGWLVLERDNFMCLFNPITRARIQLPPLTSSTIINIPALYLFQLHRRLEFEDEVVDKAIISANPSLNLNNTFVVVFHRFGLYWAFCRVGGDSWTKVHSSTRSMITDVTYHNGRFYSLDMSGEITRYSTGPVVSVSVISAVPPHINSCFVVSSSTATISELLIVTWNDELQNNEGYTVYKLDLDNGQQTPNSVTNIGNKILFWDNHACLAFSTSSGWKYSHEWFSAFFCVQSREEGDMEGFVVCLNLQNGHSLELPYNLGPTLLNLPGPMWFSPCLF